MNNKTETETKIAVLEILNKDFKIKYSKGSSVYFDIIQPCVYIGEDMVEGNCNCTRYNKKDGSEFNPKEWQNIPIDQAVEICERFAFGFIDVGRGCYAVFHNGVQQF